MRIDPHAIAPQVTSEQTDEQIERYLASKEFGTLPVEERAKYLDDLRDSGREIGGRRPSVELTEAEREQRRKNIGEVFHHQMEKRIDRYFELPEAQRTAYLDQQIDEMQRHFAERRARREREGDRPGEGDRDRERRPDDSARREGGNTSGTGQPGQSTRDGRWRGPTPERIKYRIETTDPVQRAKHMEFRKAMRERMEKRGIQHPWGHRGGSGGGPR